MFILFVVVALAVAGISGTVLALHSDGYRRVHTDRSRLPIRSAPRTERPAPKGSREPARVLHRSAPVGHAR